MQELNEKSYVLATFDPAPKKAKTHYPLQDNGLASEEEWRGRRDDYRTFGPEWSRFLAEFREWCETEALQMRRFSSNLS